jgi:Protein of unknown function (DUF3618)
MAQDAQEIRETIGQTRDQIGETLQAIGEKTDVKARATAKVSERRDALKQSSSGVKAKLDEVAQRIEESLPDAARPVVTSAVEWAATPSVDDTELRRRRRLTIYTGLAMAVAIMFARRVRRHRALS